MKRTLSCMIVCLTLLAGSYAHAQTEHAAGPAEGQSHATAVEHDQAPLLPGNVHEFKEYFLGPAIWTLVIFVIMLVILYPTAWKNVLAGLKQREKRIRDDIANAEAARKKAEQILLEYNTKLAQAQDNIRDMLAKATADGEKLATSIRMKAQQEAEEVKERANKDIEAARDAALREIYEKAADLATSVAEKIIRKNLNPADQQELVQQSLAQLQSAK